MRALLVASLAASAVACGLLPDDDEEQPPAPSLESANTTCAPAADAPPDDLACTGLYSDAALT